jgi:hypothetical protein
VSNFENMSDAAAAIDIEYSEVEAPDNNSNGIGKKKKPTTAEDLVKIGLNAELWTEGGVAWATIEVGDHFENRPISRHDFREYLSGVYFETTGMVANDKALRSTCEILSFNARKYTKYTTSNRWTRFGDRIYCDLGRADWSVVEISREGWRILPMAPAPVKFRHSATMKELPLPVAGGSMKRLKEFCSCTDEGFTLITGAILDACKGFGPYFCTSLIGEQGSGKSIVCRFIRRIVDPVLVGELSGKPKSEHDLGVQAQHEHILAYDNVSYIDSEFSDVLCRASTGGGIKTRKLYSNDEMMTLAICSPVLCNSIPEVITAQDLASRSIIVRQPVIEHRMEEKVLFAAFDEELPRMFGALLDLMVRGLGSDEVELPTLGRMADSIRWVTACMGDLTFYNVHRAVEETNQTESLDDSLLLELLRVELADAKGTLELTAGNLHHLLTGACNGDHEKLKKLPQTARATAGQLRRFAPALRKAWKWDITERTLDGRKMIRIEAIRNCPKLTTIPGTEIPVSEFFTELKSCVPNYPN